MRLRILFRDPGRLAAFPCLIRRRWRAVRPLRIVPSRVASPAHAQGLVFPTERHGNLPVSLCALVNPTLRPSMKEPFCASLARSRWGRVALKVAVLLRSRRNWRWHLRSIGHEFTFYRRLNRHPES